MTLATPQPSLAEMIHCRRRDLFGKAHIHAGAIGEVTLGVPDDMGNRRWAATDWIESHGFVRIHDAPQRCDSSGRFMAERWSLSHLVQSHWLAHAAQRAKQR